MKSFLHSGLMAVATLLPLSASAADGLRIERQNPSHSMVRVDSTAHYILLPVQEGVPISNIEVLANGKLANKLNVALAENHVDYYVPFDLTPFGNDEVALSIVSHVSRNNIREAEDAVWNQHLMLSDTFDKSNTEKFRPLFHHTPEYGWMNDPNGMFYKDGVWHLYYQYNPYGSKWENMSWGHSTSRDLINWEHQPVALVADDLGAIFSGSSVVDHNNTAGFGKDAVISLYTSAGPSQTQSLVWSDDNGQTFKHYNGNPVIFYGRESRDPNMFWYEPLQQWVLILASALDHEMLIFNSPDLKNWTLASKFGQGFGAQDGVWECPDLVELSVDGSDRKKWVLLCNLNPGGIFGGSATQYFIGDFDGKTFTPDDPQSVTKWMDYGKDHYATVTFSGAPDGRTTALGWMSNWEYANDVPTMQFRSANTIARDLSLFTAPDGKLYLASTPSAEYDAMRGKVSRYGSTSLSNKARSYSLPTANQGICEIVFDIEMDANAVADVTLSNSKGEKVVMTLNAKNDTFSMDRTASGVTSFSDHFPAVTVAPMHADSKNWKIRLFVDRSSIEAFEGRGRMAMTNLVFPENPYTSISMSATTGKAKLKSLEIYPIQPSK
ncbi:MAG: DUF4980 domain-containing protein [Bacteroides sp.]|nr:DUF4980 domain-containing protein [Bacteroides sp.]